MKKTRSLTALAVLFLFLPSLGTARQGQGTNIIALKQDSSQLSGELVAVKPDTLVLLLNQRNAGTDVSVDVKDIAEIRIPKKSHTVLGIGLGLLAGMAVGFLARPHSEPQGTFSSIFIEPTLEQYAGVGVVALSAAAGAGLGGIIGAAAGSDKVYRLRNMDETTVKGVLLSLSEKARVKGIQ